MSVSLNSMVTETEVSTPGRRGELIQRAEVRGVWILDMELSSQQLVHLFRENATDGVDRVVTVESLVLQTGHRANNGWQLHGELALNDGVNPRVDGWLRQLDMSAAMILLDERDLLFFVEAEPFGRVWRNVGIVPHASPGRR